MHIFLTGKPGIGKTTIIEKLFSKIKEATGFFTKEVREGKTRTGFLIYYKNKPYPFASIYGSGIKFGKYKINTEWLDKIIDDIEQEKERFKVLLIDEIGKMEFFSQKFEKFIWGSVKSDKPILIATLHRSFVDNFKQYGKIIEVTKENRNVLPNLILNYLNIEEKKNNL